MFENLFNRFSFWNWGLWRNNAVVDQTAPLLDEQPAPIAPQDPTERNDVYNLFGAFGLFGGDGFCNDVPPLSPFIAWEMRKYPAIVLAHAVTTAPIIAGTRSMDVADDGGKPDEAKKIQEAAAKDLLPIFGEAIEGAVEDLHFGHWLQEVIWDRKGSRTVPCRVASFLPTQAEIHVNKFRQFVGFKHNGEFRDAAYAFLSVNQPHIDPVLGFSRNENAKADWWETRKANWALRKVQEKSAGRQMMVGVPIGSTFVDKNGQPLMPEDWFKKLMAAVRDNEAFPVPLTPFTKDDIKNKPELANIPAVKIDKFDWGQMGESINAILKTMDMRDRNMIRAWRRPERESTEGHHGTNAESATQGQIGVTDSELIHQSKCHQWDAQVTRRWQLMNFPDSEDIWIRTKPAPLSDPQQQFLQKMAAVIATDTATGPQFMDNADVRGLQVRVEMPVVDEETAAKNKQDRENQTAKQQPQVNGNAQPINGNNVPVKVTKGDRVQRLLANRRGNNSDN